MKDKSQKDTSSGRKFSITFKTVGISIVALIGLAFITNWIALSSFSSYFSEVLQEKADRGAQELRYVYETKITESLFLAERISANRAASEILKAANMYPDDSSVQGMIKTLAEKAEWNGLHIALFSEKGKPVYVQGDIDPAKVSEMVASALSRKNVSGWADGVDGTWFTAGASTVYERDGKVLGVAVAGYDAADHTIIDKAKELSGVEVTLFRNDMRINTTIINEGKRAVGTKLGEAVSAIVLGKGETYRGTADILGHSHITTYLPIKDANGNRIGIYFAGSSLESALVERNNIIKKTMIISLLFMVIFVVLSVIVIRKIVAPIKKLLPIIEEVGKGNFSIPEESIDVRSSDEVGLIARAFRDMYSSIKKELFNASEAGRTTAKKAYALAETSKSMQSSAEKIASASVELSAFAQDNAAALEEANASIEEISSGASAGAENASSGAESASVTTQKADEAGLIVRKTMESIATIGGESSKTMNAMKNVEKAVGSITSFVGTITSIADQTNLLALNAAIEAARAGDAGRGFAVVADEVRKLAEESNKAAGEVRKIVSTLENHAKESVSSMERVNGVVTEVSSGAKDAWDRLSDVLGEINKINEVLQNIAAATEEQAAASHEAAQGIDSATNSIAREVETVGELEKIAEKAKEHSKLVMDEAESMKEIAVELVKGLKKFRFAAVEKNRDGV